MKYSEKDMAALISEVETKFAKHLAKAEAEQEYAESEELSEETVATNKHAQAKAADKVEKSESEEVLDYSDEDVAEMNKMYSSMSKSEKEAHYQSVKQAIFGEGQGSEKEPKASVKAETQGKKELSKSELPTEQAEAETLLKAEVEAKDAEIAELKKSQEELQDKFQTLISTLTKSVKRSAAPKQKAVTQIQYVTKSEEGSQDLKKKEEVDVEKLSAPEVSSRLTEKIRSGKLEKSDKETINQYYALPVGERNIDSIKHLL